MPQRTVQLLSFFNKGIAGEAGQELAEKRWLTSGLIKLQFILSQAATLLCSNMREECWLKWFSQVIDSAPVISCIFSCSILQIQEAQCTVLSLRRNSYISNFPSGQADAVIFPGLNGNMAFTKLTFRFHSFFYLNEINFLLPYEPMVAMLTECPDKESTGIKQILWNGHSLEFQWSGLKILQQKRFYLCRVLL